MRTRVIIGFILLFPMVSFAQSDYEYTDPPARTLFWTSTPGSGNKIIIRGVNSRNQSVSLYESSKANSLPVRCIKE